MYKNKWRKHACTHPDSRMWRMAGLLSIATILVCWSGSISKRGNALLRLVQFYFKTKSRMEGTVCALLLNSSLFVTVVWWNQKESRILWGVLGEIQKGFDSTATVLPWILLLHNSASQRHGGVSVQTVVDSITACLCRGHSVNRFRREIAHNNISPQLRKSYIRQRKRFIKVNLYTMICLC